MKPYFFFLIITIVTGSQMFAQDFYPLKRKPFQLSLPVDKKLNYEQDVVESTYLLPDLTLQMYPGEVVYLEIEQENGTIKNIRAVGENKFPAKTLVITFNQTLMKKLHDQMILKIENPFKYALKYDTKIYLVQYKKWVNTNVLRVEPGLSAFESWPDVITSISLGEWRFQ